MKATINQQKIAKALNIVTKAINNNNTLPILNNILVETTEQGLKFSATNLEIAISYTSTGSITEQGSITIPAKLITSYVSLLHNTDLELSSDEKLNLHIQSDTSKTEIKGLQPEDYPSIPKIEEQDQFKIKIKDLLQAINQTVFASSINNTRPILSGVYVHVEEKQVTFAATDSYRLAEKKVAIESSSSEELSCIVPGKTLQELSKILPLFNEELDISISLNKNQISFQVEDLLVVSRLIEGNFPNYKEIIPKDVNTTIIADASELNLALKRINLFAREINNSIHLEGHKESKKLNISTDETKIGAEVTELDIDIQGENNRISLNSQYLLDVLNIHSSGALILKVVEKSKPIKVVTEKDDNFVYIIMPLKV